MFDASMRIMDYNPLVSQASHYVVTAEPTPTLSFGGSGFGFANKWVYGGEGVGLHTSSPDEYTTYDGGYGMFDLGYLLLAKKGKIIFPCVGFGGYNNSVIFSNIGNNNIPFDSLFSSNFIREQTIYSKGMMIDGSLHFDFLLKGNSGTALGINVGYTYCLSQKTTTVNKIKLDNAPDFNMNGLHFGLSLGFGGLKEKGD